MFKNTKIKIILSIMISVLLLFATTLAVILIASYRDIKIVNSEKLMRYSNMYQLDYNSKDYNLERNVKCEDNDIRFESDKPINSALSEQKDFQLSTFYSVAFSKEYQKNDYQNKDVLYVDNGEKSTYGESELIEIAINLLSKNKMSGNTGKLAYLISFKPDYILVSFLDSTISQSNINILLRNYLISSFISLIVLFFISLILANRIVKPIEENDKKQKQFISDASHELKTPISIIEANAEMLDREISSKNDTSLITNSRVFEWLSNIRYENERMGSLVKILLDLSSAESKKVIFQTIDFSHILTGELLAFESLAYENGINIITDIEDNIYIKGSKIHLEQLVSVLLDNAIKYSTEKEITVTLHKKNHTAVLSVINNSNEIPKDKINHIFERFYRIDEVRNSEENHYGLGLSIAKAVSEMHKGNIMAKYKDGKITFNFTFFS